MERLARSSINSRDGETNMTVINLSEHRRRVVSRSRKLLTLDMPLAVAARLDAIRDEIGARDTKQVVTAALRLLSFAAEGRKTGWSLRLVRGNDHREISLPWLITHDASHRSGIEPTEAAQSADQRWGPERTTETALSERPARASSYRGSQPSVVPADD
jgi:hypothetical protein